MTSKDYCVLDETEHLPRSDSLFWTESLKRADSGVLVTTLIG